MREHPLHARDERRDIRRTRGADDPDVDEVRARRNSGIRAARRGAVTGDESRDMGAMSTRIGGCHQSRAGAATREVDRGDDPSREVRVRRDTAVQDRDSDALTGHPELTPGLGRTNLDDAGARGERRAIQRIERRRDDLVQRHESHVLVV